MDRRSFFSNSAAGVLVADPLRWASLLAPPVAAAGRWAPVGQPVNLATYGDLQSWLNPAATRALHAAQAITRPAAAGPLALATLPGADGWVDVGVMWPEARTLNTIVLDYAAADTMPAAGTYVLEWWTGVTNQQGTWHPFDDKTTKVQVTGKTWTVTFPDFRTYRVRLRLQPPPHGALAHFAVYGPSTWKSGSVRIEWGHEGGARSYDGHLETYNGEVLQLTPVGATQLTGPLAWTSTAGNGTSAGLEASVLYTTGLAVDRSILTLRTAGGAVSFLPGEAVEGAPIDVPAMGVYVRERASPVTRAAYRQQNAGKQRMMDAVAQHSEQTYDAAFRALSPGWRTPLSFVGVDANNHKFGIAPNGQVDVSYEDPSNGTTMVRQYTVNFGATEQPAPPPSATGQLAAPTGLALGQQSLEDGWLPIITTTWRGNALTLDRTDYGVLQHAPLTLDEATLTGTEPAILISRLTIRNASTTPQMVGYDIAHDRQPDALSGGLAYTGANAYIPAYVLCYVDPQGRGTVTMEGHTIHYALRLEPGEAHTMYTVIPAQPLSVALWDVSIAALQNLPYARLQDATKEYWTARVAEGMQVQVPDARLQHLWQASVHHWGLVLTKDHRRGEYYPHVAPRPFGTIGTESSPVMQVMDMRGMHTRAERCLEAWLSTQGDTPPIGDYPNPAVLVHLLEMPTAPVPIAGYANLPGGFYHFWPVYTAAQGTILWTLAKHYLYTGDTQWLRRVAPHIIAGCDFLIAARKRTQQLTPGVDKPLTYGLAPAGCALDGRSQHYAFALNGYFYLGLKKSAQVLQHVDPQQAARIEAEAADYLQAIRRALTESIIRAPVTRLRDNTSVICVPPYVGVRGFCREVKDSLFEEDDNGMGYNDQNDLMMGSLQLINCQVVDPDGPEATAMLHYFEDIIFTPDNPDWFNTGGFFPPMPYYCHAPEAYLQRDQIPNFLRAFFNTVSAMSDAQTLTFSECGKGQGQPHKTEEEAWFLIAFRNLLLVEADEDLILARATPRQWLADGQDIVVRRAPSYFGELSYTIHSAVHQGRIEAVVHPPQRRPPAHLYLRLRHPTHAPLKRVTIGGHEWTEFNVDKEWITLPHAETDMTVMAYY